MGFLTDVSGTAVVDPPSPNWIFERIEDWSKQFPEKIAFAADHQDRVDEYRYADVLNQAQHIASALTASGIQKGDRIGILMENIPEWVFVLLGAMRIGVITVPLATTLPENSLVLIANHAGCKLIFADDANWEKAKTVSAEISCDVVNAGIKPATTYRADSAVAGLIPAFTAHDTAIIVYTSGTTGNPKGVELTYDNLNHEIRGAIEMLELSPDHRILSVLPFSHVLALIANGLGPLCAGAGVVFLSSISPQRIIEAFHKHRITLFVCVPQFFYILHKRIFSQVASQSLPARTAFSFLKRLSRRTRNPALARKFFSRIHQTIGPGLQMFACGGSHFDPRIARDFSDLGYTMLQSYGLTETTAAATITPVGDNRIGTVGKPIRGLDVRIDSPDGEGIGEVRLRGPSVMKGYYRSPEETAATIQDGWLKTGDLGFIDAEGQLSITGRIKDVIVLDNGKNVYPEELETHYSQSPFVKEICVLGMPGEEDTPTGETVHAIIVPDLDEFRRRGQTAIMEMIRFEIENLSKRVPPYYRIHSLSVRNEPFPRTVTRKLKRFEIQQEEAERRKAQPERPRGEDHPRFRERAGSVIAQLVRESRTDVGALDPSMNIELDLGFDSLARVELLGLAEAQLGTHIDEHDATRIFTLGELIDAFETASISETSVGRSWKEILETAPAGSLNKHYIFKRRLLLNPVWVVAMWSLRTLARALFPLRYYGLENLPEKLPFIICPNHESFLDGPLLVSLLPRRVIYNIFILGYSDYWASALSRRIAQMCNIVAIDPNVNLVKAMQVGATGLKHGRALLIFPEGTRSIDGHVEEFKKGAAILAFELGVPIVPVGIRGSFEAWPRGGSFRLHPIEYHFGTPIHPGKFARASDPYSVMTDALREEVQMLSADERREQSPATARFSEN